jgi:hypothetical protein
MLASNPPHREVRISANDEIRNHPALIERLKRMRPLKPGPGRCPSNNKSPSSCFGGSPGQFRDRIDARKQSQDCKLGITALRSILKVILQAEKASERDGLKAKVRWYAVSSLEDLLDAWSVSACRAEPSIKPSARITATIVPPQISMSVLSFHMPTRSNAAHRKSRGAFCRDLSLGSVYHRGTIGRDHHNLQAFYSISTYLMTHISTHGRSRPPVLASSGSVIVICEALSVFATVDVVCRLSPFQLATTLLNNRISLAGL